MPLSQQDWNDLGMWFQSMLAEQRQQTALLNKLVDHHSAPDHVRMSELDRWKQANPELSHNCGEAARHLNQVLNSLLSDVAEEAAQCPEDGYMRTEFIDQHGPRLVNLNALVQAMTNLGS